MKVRTSPSTRGWMWVIVVLSAVLWGIGGDRSAAQTGRPPLVVLRPALQRVQDINPASDSLIRLAQYQRPEFRRRPRLEGEEVRTEPLFIPLPAFSTSPNKGNDFGVLPVWLFFDEKGKIEDILAPSAIFNTKTGLKGAFRWIGYLPNDTRFRLIVSQSISVDSDYFADIESPRLGPDGRWALSAGVRFERDPTEVFFGFGPTSKDREEAGFTRRDVKAHLNPGINFGEFFRLSYTERLRHILLEAGGRTTDDFIGESFPEAPGVDTWVTISARGLSMQYDDRDSANTPTKGHFGLVGLEVSSESLGSEFSFTRLYGELKTYIPWPSTQWITAVRLAGSYVDNPRLPHYEQSVLGGNDFRGLPNDRFVDRGVIKANLEERIRMVRLELMRVPFDVETAPFIEVGQVFRTAGDLALKEVRVGYGVGFRAVVRPNVVGKIDVGAADEGVNIRVGLDYPF